jgi:hypothetical protein
MKFLVDELPYFKTDCPFCEDGYKEDRCKAGHGHECVFFKNGRNPEDCPYLKELDSQKV